MSGSLSAHEQRDPGHPREEERHDPGRRRHRVHHLGHVPDREVLVDLFVFSDVCSCEVEVWGLWVLLTTNEGKGEIEKTADLVTGSAWVGKGKENGNVYRPATNFPSNLFFCVLVPS